MSGDREGLAGKAPPDWVRLSDVPHWIEVRFRERPSDQWMMELIELLKREPTLNRGELILPYRVQGLSASPETYLPNGPKGTLRQDLPGLKVSLHDPLDTSVASWDQANFDTRDFTVAGAPRPDGGRTRHEIELLWVNVVRRECQRIEQRRRRQQREAEMNSAAATAEPDQHGSAKTPYEPSLFSAAYRMRVEGWHARRRETSTDFQPPSPTDDETWAQAEYRDVPRRALREARRKHAPSSWKKSGKKTGVKWRE